MGTVVGMPSGMDDGQAGHSSTGPRDPSTAGSPNEEAHGRQLDPMAFTLEANNDEGPHDHDHERMLAFQDEHHDPTPRANEADPHAELAQQQHEPAPSVSTGGNTSLGQSLISETSVGSRWEESTDRTPADSSLSIASFEKNILALIEDSLTSRVPLCDLAEIYKSKFGHDIPYEELGSDGLKPLLAALPHVDVRGSGWGKDKYVCKAEPQPSPALSLSDDVKVCDNTVSVSLASSVEQKILFLIEESGNLQVLLGEIPALYKAEFGTDIPYKKLGVKRKLKPLLETFPRLDIKPGDDAGVFYVCKRKKDQETERNGDDAVPQEEDGMPGAGSPPGSVEQKLHALIQKPETIQHAISDPQTSNTEGTVDAGTDSLDARIKDAAARLTGGKTHRALLSFLAQHPHGVTTSQIMKSCKGIIYNLKDLADEIGAASISPLQFLCHCEGVHRQTVDGRNLFFNLFFPNSHTAPESMICSTRDTPQDKERESELEEGVALLRLLNEKFVDEEAWPGKKKILRKAVTQLNRKGLSGVVQTWLQHDTEGLTQSHKNTTAIDRAMERLRSMKCLFGTPQALKWDMIRIESLLKENEVESSGEQENLNQTETKDIPQVNELGCGVTGGKTSSDASHVSPMDQSVADSVQSYLLDPETQVSICMIESAKMLEKIVQVFPFDTKTVPEPETDKMIAVDLVGAPDNIFLLLVATSNVTFVFDCVQLDTIQVCRALFPFFMGDHVTKVFHDLSRNALALHRIGGVSPLLSTMDMQLAVEALSGEIHCDFESMLRQLGPKGSSFLEKFQANENHRELFALRPLAKEALDAAIAKVRLLFETTDMLSPSLSFLFESVQRASDQRARWAVEYGGRHRISFDPTKNHKVASWELLSQLQPSADLPILPPLKVSQDMHALLDMIPSDLHPALKEKESSVSEIVLDVGRPPAAYSVTGQRFPLSSHNERLIDQAELEAMIEPLEFGTNYRARPTHGQQEHLHRISALYSSSNDIVGLTIKVGRHVTGNAAMIADLLESSWSILLVGLDSTCWLREVCFELSKKNHVLVIDTDQELGGDGNLPHSSLGFARRVVVSSCASITHQGEVMVQAVQNHAPHVLVVPDLVDIPTAKTCKDHGVRLVACSSSNNASSLQQQLEHLFDVVVEVLPGSACRIRGLNNGNNSKSSGIPMVQRRWRCKQPSALATSRMEQDADMLLMAMEPL